MWPPSVFTYSTETNNIFIFFPLSVLSFPEKNTFHIIYIEIRRPLFHVNYRCPWIRVKPKRVRLIMDYHYYYTAMVFVRSCSRIPVCTLLFSLSMTMSKRCVWLQFYIVFFFKYIYSFLRCLGKICLINRYIGIVYMCVFVIGCGETRVLGRGRPLL